MGGLKIYVASSWRNMSQPHVVSVLRVAGHQVYDFRNPVEGNHGFRWSQIDPDWPNWSGSRFAAALSHPIAEEGFRLDKAALDWCDACVLVLPSGRSAHLEAGYVAGQGKPVVILLGESQEPELMYKLADACVVNIAELLDWLEENGRRERH